MIERKQGHSNPGTITGLQRGWKFKASRTGAGGRFGRETQGVSMVLTSHCLAALSSGSAGAIQPPFVLSFLLSSRPLFLSLFLSSTRSRIKPDYIYFVSDHLSEPGLVIYDTRLSLFLKYLSSTYSYCTTREPRFHNSKTRYSSLYQPQSTRR